MRIMSPLFTGAMVVVSAKAEGVTRPDRVAAVRKAQSDYILILPDVWMSEQHGRGMLNVSSSQIYARKYLSNWANT